MKAVKFFTLFCQIRLKQPGLKAEFWTHGCKFTQLHSMIVLTMFFKSDKNLSYRYWATDFQRYIGNILRFKWQVI